MNTRVRPLVESDAEPLGATLGRAYATGQDFTTRLRGYVAGCGIQTFVAEHDGTPVGFVAGIDYGASAYVALMGVDPAIQGLGTGTLLMEALCAWVDRRGFASVELDATAAGARLYERFGFRDAGVTAVYEGGPFAGPQPASVCVASAADRTAMLACDRAAFGADRSVVLSALFENPQATAFVPLGGDLAGYVVAQAETGLIGSLVACDPDVASRLLAAAAVTFTVPHRLSVPRETPGAEAIVIAHGYSYARELRHMLLGTPPAGARERIFARINLGHG